MARGKTSRKIDVPSRVSPSHTTEWNGQGFEKIIRDLAWLPLRFPGHAEGRKGSVCLENKCVPICPLPLWVSVSSFGKKCKISFSWVLTGGSNGKESACNSGDLGLIPGWGRSLGAGNSNPLHYSCLENSVDTGAWQATVILIGPRSQADQTELRLGKVDTQT